MNEMQQKTTQPSNSRKELILRRAAQLIRERGYLSTTLRELAKECGIKGGSIYHHFSSKQEILFQIMDQTMNNLINKLELIMSMEEDPVLKLKKAIGFHIEYHVVDSDETNVTDAELRHLEKINYNKIVVKRRLYEDIFLKILQQGVEQKMMHIEDMKLTCKAIIQLCTSVALWYKKGGPLSIEQVAEGYTDLICWGVLGKGGIS